MMNENNEINIPIDGIKRAGTDNVIPDGAMNEVVGLEYKDGSYVPYIGKMKSKSKLAPTSSERHYVHKTSTQDNHIAIRLVSVKKGDRTVIVRTLNWMSEDDWKNDTGTAYATLMEEPRDVEFVGNMMCVSTDDGIRYFLFDSGEYKETSMFIDGLRCSVRVSHGFTDKDGEKVYGGYHVSSFEDDTRAAIDKKLIKTGLLSAVRGAGGLGGLTGVFLVSTAFRRKDGSLTNVSTPIMLSYPWNINIHDGVGYVYTDEQKSNKVDLLNLGEGYYSQIAAINEYHPSVLHGKSSTVIYPIKEKTITIGGEGVFGRFHYYAARGNENVQYGYMYSPYIAHVSCMSYRDNNLDPFTTYIESCCHSNGLQFMVQKPDDIDDIVSVCIFISREVDVYKGLSNIEENVILDDSLNNFVHSKVDNVDGGINIDTYYPKMRDVSEVLEEVSKLDRLYLVEEKPIEDLSFVNGKTDWVEADLKGKLNDSLVVREQLPITDFYEWSYRGNLKAYNSRLNVYGAESKIRNFTFGNNVFYHNGGVGQPSVTEISDSSYEIVLFCKDDNGREYTLVTKEEGVSIPTFVQPALFFYKDVYKVEIYVKHTQQGQTKYYYAPITTKKSQGLGLSYWYGNGLSPLQIKRDTVVIPEYSDTNVWSSGANKIVVSNTYAPKVFDEKSTLTIGNGRILKLASLSIALSQDNFGTYPLIALCTDGIYSIGIGTNGRPYSEVPPPFSREVCINKDATCEIDGAVLFVSEKGLMVATAEQATMYTPALNGIPRNLPSNADDASYGMKLYNKAINHADVFQIGGSDLVSQCDFIEFLKDKNTRISYVSAKNKIIIYNGSYSYCYWIDIATKNTTKLPYRIVSDDNNYPEEEYYDGNGNIIDFDYNTDEGFTRCLLQSRPIKLSGGFKQGFRVVVRGGFGGITGNENDSFIIKVGSKFVPRPMWAELLVLGSLDAEHWIPIGVTQKSFGNGKFHDLGTTTSRGTWKYAMVILAAELSSDSHIDGIQLTANVKYNDKLR